jgi:pyrimidine-nucleoside phosphorylase
MNIVDIINKKRVNKKLTHEELDYAFNGYLNGTVKDYQMSSLLMAICINGMTDEETFDLTDIFIKSGDVLDLSSIPGVKVDKHSTGGVGDKVTLIIGPIVSSCGVPVPKMSGRGLGHTGGTIDKLEAIKGFSTELTSEQFVKAVNKVGLAIVGQTGNLVPADKKMYALRDVTATVDSIPLIAASIMSKKLAVCNKGLVLDVKVGSGAFMKTVEDARKLASLMVKIGAQAGRKVAAVLTNMDEPLGEMVGNACEIIEAIDTLHYKGPESFTNLIKELCSEALMLENPKLTKEEAVNKVIEVLKNGKAFEKLIEMVESQGGDSSMIKDYSKLPHSAKTVELKADKAGYISQIQCEEVGLSAMMLGAGRETKEDKIDMGVGLKLVKHVGDQVKVGDVIAELYINPERKDNEKAMERLRAAINIVPEKVEARKLILDIVRS